MPDEHGRPVHGARESSPSPAGSNYTTASESDRQQFSESANLNHDEKSSAPRQFLPDENLGQQTLNVEKNVQVDLTQIPNTPVHGQASSNSSSSTLVPGNDANITPQSTVISESPNDLKHAPIGLGVSSDNSEETNTGKQEISLVSGAAPVLSKVTI